MSDELPRGWASIRLEELVSARKGKKPGVAKPTPKGGFVPYLDIQAIEKGEIYSYAEAASSRLGTADDIFVVWDGARSGWAGLGREGAIGSTIMAIRPKTGHHTYLYRWLQSQFQHVNTNTRGTGIPHVDPEVFWNLAVPLAPFAEQRRIVAKLEKLLGKLDSCQQLLAKIPVLLKRFRQSVLAAPAPAASPPIGGREIQIPSLTRLQWWRAKKNFRRTGVRQNLAPSQSWSQVAHADGPNTIPKPVRFSSEHKTSTPIP